MNLKVKPVKKIEGTVNAPSSKSYTHRAIIISSLANGKSIINNPLISGDTLSSINACKALGSKIEINENELVIEGNSGNPKLPQKIIDVQNSGTTLRFITSVASLCPGKVTLTGDESIQKRPMQPLLDALEQLDIKTSSKQGKPPITVEGPLKGGNCSIEGDISSQFISSLLISLPLTEKGGKISIKGELKSRPYVDMTLDLLEKFNSKIDSYDNRFEIGGDQNYEGIKYQVEGDYSSAAFILAAAALTNSQVRVNNLNPESKQGDRTIIFVLDEMGAKVEVGKDYVEVKGDTLKGIDVDLSNSPDLVPIVSVLGSLAEGKTFIKNVEHLRYKESDRLHAISTELKKMGADIMEGKDYLEIRGREKLSGTDLYGWKDHRIVMALAVASLKTENGATIDSADSIRISFPEFIETMNGLGCNLKLTEK